MEKECGENKEEIDNDKSSSFEEDEPIDNLPKSVKLSSPRGALKRF